MQSPASNTQTKGEKIKNIESFSDFNKRACIPFKIGLQSMEPVELSDAWRDDATELQVREIS